MSRNNHNLYNKLPAKRNSRQRRSNPENWKKPFSVSLEAEINELLREARDDFGIDINQALLTKGIYDILNEVRPDEMSNLYELKIASNRQEIERHKRTISSLEEEIEFFQSKIEGLKVFHQKLMERQELKKAKQEALFKKELHTRLRELYNSLKDISKKRLTPIERQNSLAAIEPQYKQIIAEVAQMFSKDEEETIKTANRIWKEYIIEAEEATKTEPTTGVDTKSSGEDPNNTGESSTEITNCQAEVANMIGSTADATSSTLTEDYTQIDA